MSSRLLRAISRSLAAAERAAIGDAGLKHTLSKKELAVLRKYVSEAGRVTEEAKQGGSGLRKALIGSTAAPEVVKARYAQGGLLGPGGVLLGDLAMTEPLRQSLRRTGSRLRGKAVDPSEATLGQDLKQLAKGLPGQGVNLGFGLGFPIAGALSAQGMDPSLEEGGLSGVGRALGSGLGFLGAAPFGLGGSILGSHFGGDLGSSIGKLLESKPEPANNIVMDAAVPKSYT
jgi:hypothetical protein